ncbi:MAG: hypothetical protein KGH71_01465 [Candidatus Micrarchaeota archaeon]|nr:hypothetical protein [Candidatus Micrarchaeota archaeon]
MNSAVVLKGISPKEILEVRRGVSALEKIGAIPENHFVVVRSLSFAPRGYDVYSILREDLVNIKPGELETASTLKENRNIDINESAWSHGIEYRLTLYYSKDKLQVEDLSIPFSLKNPGIKIDVEKLVALVDTERE